MRVATYISEQKAETVAVVAAVAMALADDYVTHRSSFGELGAGNVNVTGTVTLFAG